MNQNLIVLTISIAVLAVIAALWARKRRKLKQARSWPIEAGRVDSTSLTMESTGNNQNAWVAVVKYSYTVQGAGFTGKLRKQFVLKGSADKWVGKYITGAPLTVRHDPNNAKDSVVFEDEQSGIGPA